MKGEYDMSEGRYYCADLRHNRPMGFLRGKQLMSLNFQIYARSESEAHRKAAEWGRKTCEEHKWEYLAAVLFIQVN